jgi:hypothetical protein
MALVKLQNFVQNDPKQTASAELFTRMLDFNSYSGNFMSVEHSNNTVIIPQDTVLTFKKGAELGTFIVYDNDLVISSADLDVGGSFTPGAEHYIYLINEQASGVLKISLSNQFPNGSSAESSLMIGKFLTAAEAIPGYAPGDILTDSISDYRTWRNLSAAYPPGRFYRQYPGEPSPKDILPFLDWQDITASYPGTFFRTEGGLSAGFENGLQADSAPNIVGETSGVMVYQTINDGAAANSALKGSSSVFQNNAGSGTSMHAGKLMFDASNNADSYGRRAEVAPLNQTFKIWRRIGNLTSETKNYYQYDEKGIYLANFNLKQDEKGYIGYNPNNMTDIAPPSVGEGEHAVFNRETEEWSVVPDASRSTKL